MSSLVLTQQIDRVAVLTLNRPERHNSLVPALLESLIAALDEVRAHTHLRSVLLKANGRSFSTGGDLRGFAGHLDKIGAYANTLVGLLNRSMLALIDLPIPVVAAVHGMVSGGSLGLVLACDVVLVTPKASFTPYYRLVGFSPDGGWTALLPELIGPKRTAEVLLGNQTITAEQAVNWGLASRIVEEQAFHEAALNTAQDLADGDPGVQRGSKQLLRHYFGDLPRRLDMERALFVEQISKPDTQQAMLAFLEKM